MTRLFRSRSCGLGRTTATSVFDLSPPTPSPYLNNDEFDAEEEEGEDDDEEEDEERGEVYFENNKPITTPFISAEHRQQQGQGGQFPILAILGAVLRKSLVTCSVETEEDAPSLEIGRPTNVRHVSHVTFDRFNGFLGLPLDLQPDLPHQVPSASASVFGVSAKSMQCCYDRRGNSVPTILLMMQKRLYSGGGLQAEGIFRINAENGQEEYVRNQLNKGFVPHGIDVHCLAGLIKAWFRELPTGVLDSLTPDQVMHCNTEEECTLLVKLLPQTEAALLDWAINLMTDVVQHEHHNKMNARNIAMVFAPNMTQMADPLTALIHAVQVMNFLKTLIMQTIREREESSATVWFLSSCPDSPSSKADPHSSNSNRFDTLESETEEKFWSFESKSGAEEKYGCTSGRSPPVMCKRKSMGNDCRNGYENGEVEGILDRLNLRKGVRKLSRHPVFQLSKAVKKSAGLGIATQV